MRKMRLTLNGHFAPADRSSIVMLIFKDGFFSPGGELNGVLRRT